MATKKKEETLSLEEALAALEQISEQMSANDLPLEESLALYEKSVRLTALCREGLKKAQLKLVSLEGGEEKTADAARPAGENLAK